MNFIPDITIIIPTYNRSRLLTHTLGSVLNQNSNIDTEIIVVDDGSTDDTADIVKSFQNKGNVKYYYQEDKGFRVAAARNIGITNAQSDICLFVDTGVFLHNNCLFEHLQSHKDEKSKVVLGYVNGFTVNEKERDDLKQAIDVNGYNSVMEDIVNSRKYLDTREPHYKKYNYQIGKLPAPWVFFWTCHVSVNKRALFEVGLFDENFNSWGGEDLELGFRLYNNKIEYELNLRALSIHYPHHHHLDDKKKSDKENLRYFHEKHQTDISALLLNHHIMDINDLLINKRTVNVIS